MNKFYLLRLFLISLLCIPFVNSQDDDTEEVVVTGSLIATDREVLSVPVDTYDRDDFESSGQPEITDLVRNLTAVSGTVNTSEQFIEGGTITGIKNVNIRGLGVARTLVLINGKRMVETAVGTILLPLIRTRVRPSPRPLMFTFLIPVTVPPSMNCSDWFTAPDTAVRFLTKSVISGIPDDSKSSLS